MGRAKRRTAAFLSRNIWCVYCGQPAETIYHCPARCMFRSKQWPEGYEFGACGRCNRSSAHDELVVAMIARLGPTDNEVDQREVVALMQGVHNNVPGVLDEMFDRARVADIRARNRGGPDFGIRDAYQQDTAVFVPQRAHESVAVFAAKLGKALYAMHVGRFVGSNAAVRFRWFTNADGEAQLIYELLLPTLLGRAALRRANRDLSDQFDYTFGIGPENSFAVFMVKFSSTFAAFIVVAEFEVFFDQMVARVQARQEGAALELEVARFPVP